MSTQPSVTYSQKKLMPMYDAELARERSVNIKASQTIAAGTILGESLGTNAVQTITITAATGGTFTLTFGGQTTTALSYAATAAQVQAALQALSSIGAGNVTVSGSAGGPYTVTFVEALGNAPVGAITYTDSTTGAGHGIGVAQTTVGVTVTPGTFAAYDSGNSDGTQIPKLLAVYDMTSDANGYIYLGTASGPLPPLAGGSVGLSAPAYVCGVFATADLVGLDSNAVTLLNARFETGTLADGGIVRIP